jgi:hypothetical protein
MGVVPIPVLDETLSVKAAEAAAQARASALDDDCD